MDSTCIRGVRLEFLWPAIKFNEFTASFAGSVVSLRRPFVCCVRRHPFTRGGRATRKRTSVTFARRDGKRYPRDPVVCQLEVISSRSQPCITSQRAGHRSNESLSLVRLVPCRHLRPEFLFRRHHRASWKFSHLPEGHNGSRS